jgi:lipoate-protein ligase B
MNVFIRDRGYSGYEKICDEMRLFTKTRRPYSDDEIWSVEHPAVFTLGRAGKEQHILMGMVFQLFAAIEVVRSLIMDLVS